MKQKDSKIRALIAEGEHTLAQGPHPERAKRDAETLLLQVFNEEAKDGNNAWLNHFAKGQNINSAWLIANQNLSTFSNFRERFKTIVNRRLAGEPIQYILGETEFYGLPFRVTADVLIPRPETEHLVEKALTLASEMQKAGAKAQPLLSGVCGPTKVVPLLQNSLASSISAATKARVDRGAISARLKSCPDTKQDDSAALKALRIVDIGTGSGAIAVALAHHLPRATVTAIDLSAAALHVARENAERNGVAIRFFEGDLLAPVGGEQFEFVVSNPPYVPSTDRETLSIEVRDYEPSLALFAGEEGLDVYRRLIPSAFNALIPGGFLLLEIGYGQSTAITEVLADSGFVQIEFVPDLQGIPRVACAQRPGNCAKA
jgi:release factor glutamine methyltransferase